MHYDLELVTPDTENQIVPVNKDGISLVIIDGEEIEICEAATWIQIIQPGSVANNPSYKDHVGKFAFVEKEGNVYSVDSSSEKISALFIGVKMMGRKLQAAYNPKDTTVPPLCQSFDGEYPGSREEEPRAERCGTMYLDDNGFPAFEAECPMAKWVEKTPPECQDYQVLVFMRVDDGELFELTVKSTSLGVWMKFIKKGLAGVKAKLRRARRKAKADGTEAKTMADYAMELSAENSGAYYKLAITLVEDSKTRAMYPLANFYKQQLADRRAKYVEDQEKRAQQYEADAEPVNLNETEEVDGKVVITEMEEVDQAVNFDA